MTDAIELHPTHSVGVWVDHAECLKCGLNSSIAGEWERLALACGAADVPQGHRHHRYTRGID